MYEEHELNDPPADDGNGVDVDGSGGNDDFVVEVVLVLEVGG